MKIVLIVGGCLAAILILALAIWLRPSRADSRLEGTWRSNKVQTIARWKQEGRIPVHLIEGFESILGKTTVTCRGRTLSFIFSTDAGDVTEVQEYRIVESGDDNVVIEAFSKTHNRILKSKVRFVNEGYWVSNDDLIDGYVEKFDRVSP